MAFIVKKINAEVSSYFVSFVRKLEQVQRAWRVLG